MTITLSALQKQRTDTAANWTSANPTLLSGELGFESDTGKVKLGTGSTAWNSLGYLGVIPASGAYPLSQLLLPSGTAAAPSLTFAGDLNTGIYRPGADQVAISTGGSGRLFVDSFGGVRFPDGNLYGKTDSTGAVALYGGGAYNQGAGIVLHGASHATNPNVIQFVNGAYSEKLRITSDGKVGVGTTSPVDTLHVVGAARFGDGTNFAGVSASASGSSFEAAAGSANVLFKTGGSERLRIDSSGRVGIGTSSPGSLLTLKQAIAASSDPAPTLIKLENGSDGGSAIEFVNSVAGKAKIALGVEGTGGATDDTFIGFSTSLNTTLSEKVRITSAGNVGIGTTSPQTLLHLASGSGVAAYATFSGNNGSPDPFLIGQDTSGLTRLFQTAAQPISFWTNSTERARVDSSGRLLVGTSSSSANTRLVVQGNTAGGTYQTAVVDCRINGANPPANYTIGEINFRDNADARGALIKSESDGDWATNDYPGRLVFSTTADGASSPTERMRIQSDGNVSLTGGNTTHKLGLDVPSGANRDIFIAAVSGITNGFQVNYIHSGTALSVKFHSIPTTASAANAFLDSADGNRIYRSTSSLRYKTDIEEIEQLRSDAVLNLRPVWYRSKAADDRKDWSWYGLIAEEVAEVEPRLVHWTYLDDDYDTETINGEIKKTLKDGAQMVPDGVQYDRLAVLLLDVVKRQQQAIETLEAKVAALEST